jgi:hypothetical protein
MMARLARFACVLLLALAAPATASRAPCERQSEPEDARLEVEGDIATIVIENKRDRCGIQFKPMMRWQGDTNLTLGTTVQITSESGEALSVTDPAYPETVRWSPFTGFGDPPPKTPQLVLQPSEPYRQALSLAKIVRDISVQRTAKNMPDLPWGQVVSVELSTIVIAKLEQASIDDDYGFHKDFAPFSYLLPPRRPD